MQNKDDFLCFYTSIFNALYENWEGKILSNCTDVNNEKEAFYQYCKSDGFWVEVDRYYKNDGFRDNTSASEASKETEPTSNSKVTSTTVNAEDGKTAEAQRKNSIAQESLMRLSEKLKDVKMLIVLDEARALLPPPPLASDSAGTKQGKAPFHEWRVAIQNLFLKKMKVFSLLLDTDSTVSNIYPHSLLDPSSRVVEGAKLFQPFYSFGFNGPWDNIIDSTITKSNTRTQLFDSVIKSADEKLPNTSHRTWNPLLTLCNHSRPLYMVTMLDAILDTGGDNEMQRSRAIGRVKTLATSKLLGNQASSNMESVCYRFALHPRREKEANVLLSSFSATLCSVSPRNNNIVVKYIPEPIFGEVPHSKWKAMKSF